MAVVKFDVSGSDPEKAEPRSMELPPKGVYTCKVLELNPGFTQGDKERPRIEVVMEIAAGPHKGYRLWSYLSMTETSAWKVDQFLRCFGITDAGKKRKGSFKTEDVIGLPLKVQVKHKAGDDGEMRAECGNFMTAEDGDVEDDGDDAGEVSDDLEVLGEAADGEDEESQIRLTELAAEHGIDPDQVNTWAEVATMISEAQGEGGGDEEPPEDEAPAEDEPEEEDLETLGINADAEDEESQNILTAKAGEAGLDPDDFPLWANLATKLAEGGETTEDNYDEMTPAELLKELKERDLDEDAIKAAKSKPARIALLREDDTSEPF